MATLTLNEDAERPDLLERARPLAELDGLLTDVRTRGQGRVVLVGGEAGVGKTSLLRRFCDESRGVQVLWGGCDPLLTPRPFGPFIDIAASTGGELEALMAGPAKPYRVEAELVRELADRQPTLVVLDDMHWADGATLDVLRLLGPRIHAVAALVVVSYRDDQLDRVHPLRMVLGELSAGAGIARLRIDPLSPAAVAELAEPRGVDARELHRVTGGNPFFVTEVLAAEGTEVPESVRDAVLARGARLSEPARRLLEAVAIHPHEAEVWLLEAQGSENVDRLEECLASGMLIPRGAGVVFRHELARLTIEQSLAPDRQLALHRSVLAVLTAATDRVEDLDRLSHHAEAAGDGGAVQRFAPAAATRAASLGAHREATGQYERALRFAAALPVQARGNLLDSCAREYALVGRFTEAIELRREAIECHRRVDDPLAVGRSHRALTWPLWVVARAAEARASALQAATVLEPLSAPRELARAYIALSFLAAADENLDETLAWSSRALEVGSRSDDIEAQALGNVGHVELLRGDEAGREKLEHGLELARASGAEAAVAGGLSFLADGAARTRMYAVGEHYVESGIEHCVRHDLDGWRPFLIAVKAEIQLGQGRWDEATESAERVLAGQGSGLATVHALTVMGRVRARRGDPGSGPALDEAHALAQPSGELWRVGPVAAARAEAAWLSGRGDAVASETDGAFKRALERESPWIAGELACWRRRAGVVEAIPPFAAEPFALELAGRWKLAADAWADLGCPYEAALALGAADDEGALRQALDELQGMGAAPAAAIITGRLRERGARGLPRGPRRTTRQHVANLTSREVEVLELLAEGFRNSQIAEELVISPRTVDHHVSAILRKLGVSSRGQAAAAAAKLGVAPKDR